MYHEDFAVMPIMVLKAKSMVSLKNREYYYVQTQNSIMRDKDKDKKRKKLEDKLENYDNLIEKVNKMDLKKLTKENVAIYATNSMLATMKELDKEEKQFFAQELKKRKISKYIKVRNPKQLIKKFLLKINDFNI